MSSSGLGFEEFMRKLVNTPPIPEKKPRKLRLKKKKVAAPRAGR
jgi:hypothetical protein